MRYLKIFIIALALCSGVDAYAHDKNENDIESAQKEVVKVTSKGLEPSTMKLSKLDASVFFVNATKDSLVTVDVNFGGKKAHCASSNMKFNTEGHMHSVEPVGPKDFALMCFPEKGTYPVQVFGVLPNNQPLNGAVIVE